MLKKGNDAFEWKAKRPMPEEDLNLEESGDANKSAELEDGAKTEDSAPKEVPELEPPALLADLPLVREYQAGGFLLLQAVIEVFFAQSRKLRRALGELAASLDDSGHFDAVEHKYESENSVKKPVLVLTKGSIAVTLSENTIRATMSGNDQTGGPPTTDFTVLKATLKFSIDRIRENLRDKGLQKSFAKPKFERVGTRIDYFTRLNQPPIRRFDKLRILNGDWASRFSNSEDKLAKFSLTLTPDFPAEAIGFDTTITVDRVDRVEVGLAIGSASVEVNLGPVARFIVIRGYLGENSLNLERIDDTHEFATEHVLEYFKGAV